MKRNFEEHIEWKRREHGDKFDDSELAPQFIPYFNSGERIKVRCRIEGELTGTVGITGGWKPCFLLMRTKRSIGSTVTLGRRDKILGVKVGRGYVQLYQRNS